MVSPLRFGANPDTAASNRFQGSTDLAPGEVRLRAQAEFAGLVRQLKTAGVRPVVAKDTPEPPKPDAVFPNNWVSFHGDTVVLYPLQAPSRRPERRRDIVEFAARAAGLPVSRIIDLSALEQHGVFLEGTGSLVLDRRERVAYAALSSRTHPEAVARFGRELDFETVTFDTRDETGMPLYHTNVMLSLGKDFAVICPEVIADPARRAAVLDRLAATGREVLAISMAQMSAFAANILELATGGGRSVIAMSETARAALAPDGLARLAASADVIAVAVPVIERIGGGSVRCMLAEIFPRA
jgi:hypothetical protein